MTFRRANVSKHIYPKPPPTVYDDLIENIDRLQGSNFKYIHKVKTSPTYEDQGLIHNNNQHFGHPNRPTALRFRHGQPSFNKAYPNYLEKGKSIVSPSGFRPNYIHEKLPTHYPGLLYKQSRNRDINSSRNSCNRGYNTVVKPSTLRYSTDTPRQQYQNNFDQKYSNIDLDDDTARFSRNKKYVNDSDEENNGSVHTQSDSDIGAVSEYNHSYSDNRNIFPLNASRTKTVSNDVDKVKQSLQDTIRRLDYFDEVLNDLLRDVHQKNSSRYYGNNHAAFTDTDTDTENYSKYKYIKEEAARIDFALNRLQLNDEGK